MMAKSGWTPPGNRSNGTIAYWNSWYLRNTGHSSRTGYLASKQVENSKKRQINPIPPRFSIGAKVLFRDGINHQWIKSNYHEGTIIQMFHKNIWYFVIETESGEKFSIPHYQAVKEIVTCTAIVLVEPQSTAMVVYQAPASNVIPIPKSVTTVAAAGELAA